MKKKNFLKCICLNKNTQVRHLDYSSKYLRQVPPEIFNHERTLESLNLDNNNITELTKELFCCKALKELILCDNELTNIPDAIGNLTNLTSLNISKNNLQQLPDTLGNCSHLAFLDASGNVFEELPDGLCRMTMLQELIANTAFLTGLPQNINRLTNLSHLEIRENDIKSLPQNIGFLVSLQYLDVGHNDLKELPESLCKMTHLTVLTADKNNLASLPEKIGLCGNLQVLEIQQNSLSFLPDSVCQCSLLSELIASNNQLQSLPTMIGQLSRLTNLRVDNNQLNRLPDSLGQLDSLIQLYASSNHLVHLPPFIGLLRRLRDLYLDMNSIVELPVEIGSCSSLSVVSLRGNKIQYLPDEIGRIPHLRMINLSNNRVKFLPISFLKLKELQAVWLNDNQIQPLVHLQSERDVDTGRKCLVCYLLPQMSNTDDPDAVDNDPSAWQLVQENRPRVVQWNDEATSESVHVKGKLPKDAPSKQVNIGKHNLGKHGKHVSTGQTISHPVSLGNGDCIMVTASSMATNPEVAHLLNQHNSNSNNFMWQGNALYPQNFPFYPMAHNGGMHKSMTRRAGSGYESDSVALQASRSRGRIGNIMLGGGGGGGTAAADKALGQIHEASNESGNPPAPHHGQSHSVGNSSWNQNHRNGYQLSGGMMMPMMMPMMNGHNGGAGGGVRYGVHPAGGGMVGGRQSGYCTDTGLIVNAAAGRRDAASRMAHRNARHNQKSLAHFKNPYDQLRIMRSSTPVSRRPESVASTTITPLPPAPSRQPPPPPQRPLPSPPFRQGTLPDGGQAGLFPLEWQMQMVTAAMQPDHGGRMLPSPNGAPHFTACPQIEDPRAANMIIPPPPSRTPPNPSANTNSNTRQQGSSYLNQFVSNNPMMVDLYHPGLTSISPSIIDEPGNLIDNSNQHHQQHQQHHIENSHCRMYNAEVRLVIHRNKGLGFSITGGITSNPNPFRPSDKGIFIAKVNPGGPADGQLKIGDKIIMVNNVSFIGVEHSSAVNTLKNCGDIVQMTVDRIMERSSDI